jgi:transcriptional regulator with XRE-family HTH domain
MSMNERLRGALIQHGMSVADLAKKLSMDEKSVGRWISKDRVPHPRNQRAAAELLNVKVGYLWPDAGHHRDVHVAATAVMGELIGIYPDRASVPRAVWLHLLEAARSNVDILVFSGTFLAQTNPRIAKMLAACAERGAEVRLCFGEPDGQAVALRDAEEGIGGTLGAKVRASLSYFTDLVGQPGCDVRLHDCTLYASVFRYDNEALINTHIWGRPASANPILHVRDTRDSDGLFQKFLEGFEQVWERAESWTASEKSA